MCYSVLRDLVRTLENLQNADPVTLYICLAPLREKRIQPDDDNLLVSDLNLTDGTEIIATYYSEVIEL